MLEGDRARRRRMPLAEAVGEFVKPGQTLCFASTPSRSNAAILEICRQFRGRDPRFALAATGFHSLAHLLGLLRLGERYIGCFFGDNYPTPRGNRLYAELLKEGYELEHWSLWSYVSALAAGAFGHPYAITRSLAGTQLGEALAARGKLIELPDPADPTRKLALVRALVPDITFLHAPVADEDGNVLFSPPFGEGFHGALAARQGAVVTVERIVPSEVVRAAPHLCPLPAHRVLAVCEAPFGAHPQPLHVAASELRPHEAGYGDDYGAYRLWRSMSESRGELDGFCNRVLASADALSAYRASIGERRLTALRSGNEPLARPPASSTKQLEASDARTLLAGRAVARRLGRGPFHSLLAGIGQAFAACRLAKLLLGERGRDIELMIETGFAGIDVEHADPFLLSHHNVASAARLTSVDNMLGALCCGGNSTCLGVIGAAQVDSDGNVNSTLVDGTLLVGGGGAPDIAACAREVLVLTQAEPQRMVRKVEYCTSLGLNVRTIVTESGVFEREGASEPWVLREAWQGRVEQLQALRERSGFQFSIPSSLALSPAPSVEELTWLEATRSGRLNPSSQGEAHA